MNDEDTAHLRVKCADCETEWVAPYGGTFSCPECGTQSEQEYVTGYVGLDGPHTIIRQVFPDDDDWPY